MKWNRTRTYSAFVAVGVMGVGLALLSTHLLQDEPTLQNTSVPSGAVADASPFSRPVQTTAAPSASEQLPSCRNASPFAKNTNCFNEPEPGPEIGSGPAADSTDIAVPLFEKVYVMGFLGEGVAAQLLQSAGAMRLAGSALNHDSVLVDVSRASPEAPVQTSIQQALKEGKYVIVDGGDSEKSSTKVNDIMFDMNLIRVEGVTAFGVVRAKDGGYHVTPLQSVADANGKRKFDQLHDVLGIPKPGFGS